jgi:SCF-associated factor 1
MHTDRQDGRLTMTRKLPNFSDLNLVRRHKTFADNLAVPPDVMKITHVSAASSIGLEFCSPYPIKVTGNFRHFVAYSTGSSSLVLIGEDTTTPQSTPDIKPGLQNRSVISVAIGDWHSAALTAGGKVLTWGEFSSGALGLGDPAKLAPGTPGGYSANTGRRQARPESVVTPTVVRFDYGTKEPRDRFAFELTAAGWHTGALVMDLDVSVLRLAVGSLDKDHSRMATSFSPLLLCLCSVPP